MEVHHVTEDAETFTCNAYLVVGDRTTLVDAGAMDGVVDEIREHTDDLEAVVMTHQHGDHVAQLETVCDAFDPEVYAYDDHPTRTHEIDDGDTVRIGDEDFDVVYTPGHADDHVSFVSDSSLFSGDVVVHDDGAFEYGSFGPHRHGPASPASDSSRAFRTCSSVCPTVVSLPASSTCMRATAASSTATCATW